MFRHRQHRAFRFGCIPPVGQFGHSHHSWGEGGSWGGGGPWGGGPFGRHFGPKHGGPRFGRGDLKYVMLDLLKEQPRHGYDIIRALEERSHGFYSPSPGSVYPTLQLLEDQGYVTGMEQDGKRVFAITDAGRAFLAERSDVVDGIRERMGAGWGPHGNPETRLLVQEVAGLGQYLFQQGRRGALRDPETVRRLRKVVTRTRAEVEAIFQSTSSADDTMI
jgi:DNA-binding PadR family transcriptional regulator